MRGGRQLGRVVGGVAREPGGGGGGGVPGVPGHRQLVATLHRLGEEGPDGGAADGVLGGGGLVVLQEGGGGRHCRGGGAVLQGGAGRGRAPVITLVAKHLPFRGVDLLMFPQ